ncbi:MAG: hypothetical protein JWQ35_2707, partial [Bacteriovoracaceae bacterium]|nr:hypothetical protein [Bacteriovoracaceae bacterium]
NEAETNFKRAQDLFKTQAISRERFDNAQATFKDLDAKMKAAQAQLAQASLNLDYTKIVAPAAGTVARKSIEVGQTVMPGQALFGFVDGQSRWVTANLKETQLEDVKLGRPAVVEIDALSGKKFKGEVESVSPSTGAVFSLLPPDNSTGNFTKVVQRVSVRIKLLDLKPEDIQKLQVGLSAFVTIQAH